MKRRAVAGIAMALVLSFAAHAGPTLDAVKKKGFVQCGVSAGLPGFSSLDENGRFTGIDVDMCRAVAAAIFGDADKVRYSPLTAKERFAALLTGRIDMLSRNTTWTLTRDTSLGVNFTGISYYDGQGFLVNKNLGIKSATQMDGASFCIQAGTTTELNLADYFRSHEMRYTPITLDTSEQTIKAFEAGRCDALTSDQSQLYALRIRLKDPSSAMVLPEVISKEPLGPAVRQNDDEWFNIVKWVLFAMINAEELRVTSVNVDEMKATSNDPDVRRLLGIEGLKGEWLGLSDDWSYNVIKLVGNYGEAFERNVGMNSPLGIYRGLNALWSRGGLQYAPPMR